jgi:hypothetical protein
MEKVKKISGTLFMETITMKLVEFLVRIDDLCTGKGIHTHAGRGRPK